MKGRVKLFTPWGKMAGGGDWKKNDKKKRMISTTYNVEHDVVTQTRGTVNADQDAVLDRGAEAHRQSIGPRARSFVVGPRVRDQASSFTEDVRSTGCENNRNRNKKLNYRLCKIPSRRNSKRLRFDSFLPSKNIT